MQNFLCTFQRSYFNAAPLEENRVFRSFSQMLNKHYYIKKNVWYQCICLAYYLSVFDKGISKIIGCDPMIHKHPFCSESLSTSSVNNHFLFSVLSDEPAAEGVHPIWRHQGGWEVPERPGSSPLPPWVCLWGKCFALVWSGTAQSQSSLKASHSRCV